MLTWVYYRLQDLWEEFMGFTPVLINVIDIGE